MKSRQRTRRILRVTPQLHSLRLAHSDVGETTSNEEKVEIEKVSTVSAPEAVIEGPESSEIGAIVPMYRFIAEDSQAAQSEIEGQPSAPAKPAAALMNRWQAQSKQQQSRWKVVADKGVDLYAEAGDAAEVVGHLKRSTSACPGFVGPSSFSAGSYALISAEPERDGWLYIRSPMVSIFFNLCLCDGGADWMGKVEERQRFATVHTTGKDAERVKVVEKQVDSSRQDVD
eukprot:750323-Hanusia_phi.AAC.2